MPHKFKVFVSSSVFYEKALNTLQEKCDVVQSNFDGFGENKDELRKDFLSLVKGADGIIWRTMLKLDKNILDAAGPQLKIIAAHSAGYDHIDIEELKKRGIKLANTQNAMDSAVADIAVALLIGACRRFKECFNAIATGKRSRGAAYISGQDIEGSTVGIVGLGGVGQTILKRLKSFNVDTFLYTGPREKLEGKQLGATYVSLDRLLRESDFVILACRLTSETNKLINAEAFKKMKNTATLINISRGDVVDQDALVEALKTGEIWAAGLDVTTPEPLPKTHPLISLPNCLILPHIGCATVQTKSRMAESTVTNVLLGLQGEKLLSPVIE